MMPRELLAGAAEAARLDLKLGGHIRWQSNLGQLAGVVSLELDLPLEL